MTSSASKNYSTASLSLISNELYLYYQNPVSYSKGTLL